jgi:hypothetical protein
MFERTALCFIEPMVVWIKAILFNIENVLFSQPAVTLA